MTATFINLRSKKLLMELLMIALLLVIASFLNWFSLIDDSEQRLYATGWNGSIYWYNFSIKNWFVCINAILYVVVVLLKITEFYQFKLRWFFLLLLPAIVHFFTFFYLC